MTTCRVCPFIRGFVDHIPLGLTASCCSQMAQISVRMQKPWVLHSIDVVGLGLFRFVVGVCLWVVFVDVLLG
jgi:hypothetical protein